MITSESRSDFHIDPIGFGTNGISNKETFANAIKTGYRLFDSADMYNNTSELANAIKESGISRNEFFINYKILPRLGKEKFLESVSKAIDKFDYVDSLMLHDAIVDNVEDLKVILTSLKPYLISGQIRNIGLSNVNSDMLKLLLKDFPEIKLIQNKFNHLEQDEEVLKICKENGIKYMGYSLFGGREEAACQYLFNIDKPAWNISELIFPVLHEMAKKYKTTPHVMLLTWSILQGTVQIPSTSRKENMLLNLEAINIASKITKEDKEKLVTSLSLQVSQVEWDQIQYLSTLGNQLALLKKQVGISLPKHRLLEEVYQENSLKPLYDLLLKQIPDQSANDRKPLTDKEFLFQLRTIRTNMPVRIITYFLEEALKFGKDKFQIVVNKLKTLCELITNDFEKESLFELISLLKEQVPFEQRYNQLDSFINERLYLKNNGYFNVKNVENLGYYEPGDLTIGILGPNKTIYSLKKTSTLTSLKQISEIIAKQFPNDFKEKNNSSLLGSFYIPWEDSKDKKHPQSSEDVTLLSLSASDGDVIGLGNKKESNKECRKINSFFHKVTDNPSAYTDHSDDIKNKPNIIQKK